MGDEGHPGWVDAATAAAVRLAAESGADVDDLLEHGATPDAFAFHEARLEQSAALPEVAADLAGLLWAECTDVPPIATILDEPAAQATLEAVAEARLQAAARLAGREHRVEPLMPIELPGTLGVSPSVVSRSPSAVPDVMPPASPPPPVGASTETGHPPRRSPRVPMLAGAAAAAIVLFGRRLRRA